ncbi:MAG: biopolymer transporter ExbD [Gammaproteobacteria bacterium]
MQVQEEGKPYDDINIVPMLDLTYVLLIIFIIMTTAAVQGIQVNLPKASATPSLGQNQTKAISITADGTIYLDTYPVTLAELETTLRGYKAANPALGKALTGAWYETLALMAAQDAAGKAAREAMAKASGTDLAGFASQLATTQMFYLPAEAVAFSRDPALLRTMDYVRTFSFAHGLLGEGAKSADAVGIAFPGGSTLGDTGNVKLRFDDTYMKMAADGAL